MQRAVRMLELLESPIGSEAKKSSGTFEEDPTWNWEVQDEPGPLPSMRSRTVRIWKRFPDGLQSLELKRLIELDSADPEGRDQRVWRSGRSQSIETTPGVSLR